MLSTSCASGFYLSFDKLFVHYLCHADHDFIHPLISCWLGCLIKEVTSRGKNEKRSITEILNYFKYKTKTVH